jgi:hypothetical protein
MTALGSIAVEELLLVLKIAFIVLLYLFIWRIVRTASKDLRLPQESFILAPGAAGAVHDDVPSVDAARLVGGHHRARAAERFQAARGRLRLGAARPDRAPP